MSGRRNAANRSGTGIPKDSADPILNLVAGQLGVCAPDGAGLQVPGRLPQLRSQVELPRGRHAPEQRHLNLAGNRTHDGNMRGATNPGKETGDELSVYPCPAPHPPLSAIGPSARRLRKTNTPLRPPSSLLTPSLPPEPTHALAGGDIPSSVSANTLSRLPGSQRPADPPAAAPLLIANKADSPGSNWRRRSIGGSAEGTAATGLDGMMMGAARTEALLAGPGVAAAVLIVGAGKSSI